MKNKVLKSIVIIMLIITLTVADLIVVGMNLVTYATGSNETEKVDFIAYFKTGEGESAQAEYEMGNNEIRLYMRVTVGTGIGFDGDITLSNSNFKFKKEILSDSIKQIEENKITLNRIRAGSTVELEVGIEPIVEESYEVNMLSRKSVLKLTGKHINNEDETSGINKTSEVELNLLVPKNIEELTNLEAKVITNKIYKIGEENKRIVQLELNSKVLRNIYPIEETTFNIELPEGVEALEVISKGTYATNGVEEKVLVKDTDYIWNETEKTLQLAIKNISKDGKISWKQEGKDSIVVTLKLDETQQIGTEEYSIKSNVKFHGKEEKTVTKEASYKLEKEVSGIITSSIENNEEIYKGKLYSKEEKEYNSTTKIEVNYANIIEGATLEEKATYKTEAEQKVANVQYKTTTIKRKEFVKILGNEDTAKIIIKDQNGEIVKEVTAFNFDSTGNLTITYPDGVTGIIIELTKPISTGILKLNHKKVIKPESYNIQEISTFKSLVEQANVKYENEVQNSGITETELKDTTAEVGVTVTPGIVSAEENNEMQISITFKSDNEKYELYKDPKFKFIMPEGITINSVGNETISASNEEFKVSKLEANGREIILEVDCEQNKYVTSDINPQITFKANVSVNKLMANKQEAIEVEYTNKYVNEKITNKVTTSPIDIIASNEKLITHLKVEKYNGEQSFIEKYSDNDTEVKGILPTDNKEIIEVPVKYTIINNYDSTIALKAKIVAKYIDRAGKEQELINYNNSEISIEAGKLQVIEQTIKIPAGLYFSEKVDIQTLAEYTYSSLQNSVNNNITLSTEIQEGLRGTNVLEDKVQLETFTQLGDGKGINETDEIYNEQIVTYVMKVTNISNKAISNVKITNKQENGNIYDLKQIKKENYVTEELVQIDYKYAELEETEKVFTIDMLKPGETKELICRVVVKKTEQSNVTTANISMSADGIEEKNIQKISNNVKDAELKVITEKIFSEGMEVYANNRVYILTRVKNLTNNILEGTKGRIYLSEGIIYTENSKVEAFNEENNSIDVITNVNYNKNGNYIDFELSNIEPGKEISIKLIAQTKELPIEETGSEEIVYSTVKDIVSNRIDINVKQIETVLSIVQTTNIKEGQKVKDGEKIIITGQIKNEGQVETTIVIRDDFPTGFEISKVTLIKDGKSIDKTLEEQGENIFITSKINKGETITLEIEITVNTSRLTTEIVKNQIHVTSATGNVTSSNEVTIEIDSNVNNNVPTDKPDIDNPDIDNPDIDNPDIDNPDVENPDIDNPDPDNPDVDKPNKQTYSISGYAWVDKNQNDVKDEDEALNNITVKIIDLNNNNMFLKDENGNEIEVKTDKNGAYEIKNLLKGKYNLIFKYDTNTFELKEKTNIKDYIIESSKEKVAISENIILESNETIDLILNEIKEFNLKLDKYISKVVVQTVNETKTSTYENKQLVKEEIQKKYLTGATVLVEYTIKISNIGELAGLATEVVDYLPEDMKFYSELNTQWYVGEDGNLYNTALASSTINPGETKTIKLILSKTMTKENTGTTTNTAEISKMMNIKGYEDIDLSNNNSKAEIIVNIATGTIITYLIAIINGIVILFVGMYFIKKKVIGKE